MTTTQPTTQPRDFGFGEEAQLLRDAARRLLLERCPPERLHRLVAADESPARATECVWDPELWSQMVELGWTAVAVPEEAGGFGMSLAAIAGLCEELGRAAVPSPLIGTLCATHVLAACQTEAARLQMRRIAEGAALSVALTDRFGSWDFMQTEVEAVGSGPVLLRGTAWFVQDARKVDAFVVKARVPGGGVGLYVVDADAPGVTVVPDAIVDLTRDQAHVELRDVEVSADRVVGLMTTPEQVARVLGRAEAAMLVLVAADMVGAAEWQLQTTAAYARERVQFDRPIGFFQAVKHPLVDMMVMIDEARSLLYDAACTFDQDPEAAEVPARMAKAAASDAASYCSSRSVQLHGGIGFTWECFVQLYFKRQKHNEVLLGDGSHQRAKLADVLIGPIREGEA
ncbi:acyl-CoA dehydrogenase family protein [Paraliomyxa miuraensis]|uniref:acyl-CoA dehydrogenase family protein n=1 Tax=Paraliomyxa miuraensis TaxID=376150 RepID=UPI00225206B0|nr:acyl-CoA dehydrogenase family protein [Paraliomyxa miuraensis]MCX4245179.1 acyl-CoA/acyl-ACP dehydrogenase [Paraliomyxa miuraensis]